MGQDDDTYKAVVLGNDNFEAWSKDLKSSALIKDVWEFINPPGVSLAPTATSEERLEWKRNSNKALGLLIKSVDKTNYDRVERIESACDAFNRLSKHHLGASAGNHFNLFAQMVDIHFDPEEPLEALSARSVDIMNKLKRQFRLAQPPRRSWIAFKLFRKCEHFKFTLSSLRSSQLCFCSQASPMTSWRARSAASSCSARTL